ncbi:MULTISPECIES: DUF732 domain-containing protein [unclassified Mycolicibacterium]|uniref:DUF732 domain-containing protein n=1 Tax=unclassified Mycolicibacterium TaxID=2636767 RepID=UPI0012DBF57E|nr:MULTISPECIES: DUF732 domain-containing protein [unclassified Mycolicibacterium]MUL83556.1 DUF732 domain-containing protein [Mycolicibacterium sp. CBMA 329]MUL90547.1 DUF732 domain-containing protein [Mycolicibacterium sp. CBMA 331]MUM00518.1 DUF732 domain-containing protein [Mycolicibacterium sp. CBMA 334]MUM25409.1 DUF732 domain-containing protein [Mycolicibacterium sp. CBMA 295]MUM41491.1 DUF732 domain-containing protein [Mycolicibacterium sp. CBMA 247]
MAARAFLTTAGVVAVALALAAPAQADPTDDSFLNALNNAGVGYGDPNATVALGQDVCPMLVEPGKNFASVASQMRGDGGMSPQMASFFTGIAIQMYCPQMMSSISDGSILNNLGALNALSGIAGFPR